MINYKKTMKEHKFIDFQKRYDKFKKNNLPTPFFDDERQTFEYVYYSNHFFSNNNEKYPEVNSTLTDALADIAFTGLYYSFNCKIITGTQEDVKITYGHSHAHSFDEVVRHLYDFPKSFNIPKEDEKFYSEQELHYLRRVQKYLLFIGLKDIEKTRKIPVSRYRNKNQKKYGNLRIYRISNSILEQILPRKIDFMVFEWFSNHNKECFIDKKVLIADEEDNIKLLIKFTKEETKLYKEIRNVYPQKDFKDDDEVIIEYFKILKEF